MNVWRIVATVPAAVFCVASGTLAQDDATRVTAHLESAQIVFGETTDLVITVEPEGLRTPVDDPVLPELPAEVVGRSRSSQVTMSGTRVRRTILHRVRLRPLRPGTMAIPPVRVTVGGRELSTSRLVLDVVDRGDVPGPGEYASDGGPPPFFVSARIDRDHARVGEQVTLSFAFYHDPRVPMAESPDYDPPESPGFWRVELSEEPRLSTERLGGRTYRVQRFDYALFPLRPGQLTIEPAAVRITVPDRVEWWRSGGTRTLATDPLVIDIEELPDGAPEEFSGTVGRYALEGRVDGGSATLGVPIELALTVRGVGNPSSIGPPALPSWPDVDVGPPIVDTDLEVDRQTVRGAATFRYLLAPRSEGPLNLGTAVFAYYDPASDFYVVDSLALGEITVLPALGPRADGASQDVDGPTLWPAREPSSPWPLGWAETPVYWFAVAAPWVLLLGAAGLVRVRRSRAVVDPREAALETLIACVGPVSSTGATQSLRALDTAREAWGDAWSSDAERLEQRARVELNAIAYGRSDGESVSSIMELVSVLRRDIHA